MMTIGLEDNGRSMTLDEFLAADGVEGYRYELVRGVLFAEEVEGEKHGQVVSNLYEMAVRHDQVHPDAILRCGGGANFLLCLPKAGSALRPDFGLVLRSSPSDHRDNHRPALVGEVVSKTSLDRDQRLKREDYLAFGLLEYWIIDFLGRRIILLTRDGDTWVERPCIEGQPIPSLVLRGLTATLTDFWADLDEYETDRPGGRGYGTP
jgi:Uma2 family endonuclease